MIWLLILVIALLAVGDIFIYPLWDAYWKGWAERIKRKIDEKYKR